jgi:hypothetical protein
MKAIEASNFRPSDYMRARRPELFSDSASFAEPNVSREVFEYQLDTLTNRKQEYQFEHFCRKLAEKEICPNLIPQTGPTGGGDSKVDTETYPVADKLSVTWYEGIGREASAERWAFAFSAKKRWDSKIQSDVKGIVATNRGYKLIYFITNQFVSDRRRAAMEDSLSHAYNLQVRILDRSWIMRAVFEHKRIQLAVDALGLSVETKINTGLGPNDLRHQGELEELDKQIADPDRYQGVPYQLVVQTRQMAPADAYLERDCFVAALLAMTTTYNLDAGFPGTKRLVLTTSRGLPKLSFTGARFRTTAT